MAKALELSQAQEAPSMYLAQLQTMSTSSTPSSGSVTHANEECTKVSAFSRKPACCKNCANPHPIEGDHCLVQNDRCVGHVEK